MIVIVFVIVGLFEVCHGLQGPSDHLGITSFDVDISILSESNCQIANSLSNITVTVPRGASALNALETAAASNSSYRFTVRYKKRLGYFIDTLAGSEATSSCVWVLFTQPVGVSQPFAYSLRGVNFFQIPVTGRNIIFKFVPNSNFPSQRFYPHLKLGIDSYKIKVLGIKETTDCPISNARPPIVWTRIEVGQSFQNVMERAADLNSKYEFRALYFGSSLGYFITEIGNIRSTNTCFFCILYKEPQTQVTYFPNFGVTNFVMPVNRGSIQFQYAQSCGGL